MPTKEVILELINRESEQLEVEEKKHGWTSRALLAALATLIWLLANQAPFTGATWQNIVFLVFLAALTIDLISSYSSMFSERRKNLADEPRFLLTSSIGSARLSLLLRFMMYAVLFIFSYEIAVNVLGVARILIRIMLALNAVACLLGIVLSYRQIPISISKISRRPILVSFLITAPMTVALAGFYLAFFENLSSFGSVDIKVSVLVTLTGCVLIKRTDVLTASPILRSLISIRRDLSLDKIDVDWATKQLDIAFSGLQVEDLLQDKVEESLRNLEKERSLLRQLMDTLKTVESFIPADAAGVGDEEFKRSRAAITALMKEASDMSDELTELSKKAAESIKKYSAADRHILYTDRRSISVLEKIVEKIEKAQEQVKVEMSPIEQQISRLKDKISALPDSVETRIG